MARPSEYNYDLCLEICELIADGGSIKKILSSKEEYPSFPTWCKWKRENPELLNLYVNALQDKVESIIENIQEVRDMALKGLIEPSVANVVMQTDKWMSSKFYPKMFGDNSKIDVTTDGEKINSIPVNIKFE